MTDQAKPARRAILVVEDDESLRDVVRTVLTMEGYEVAACGSATEALELFATVTPAMILLDVMLPGIEIEEFAAELQRSGMDPQPRIIILTANVRGREIAQHIGAAGFIEKPFAISVLLSEVARVNQLSPFAGA